MLYCGVRVRELKRGENLLDVVESAPKCETPAHGNQHNRAAVAPQASIVTWRSGRVLRYLALGAITGEIVQRHVKLVHRVVRLLDQFEERVMVRKAGLYHPVL